MQPKLIEESSPLSEQRRKMGNWYKKAYLEREKRLAGLTNLVRIKKNISSVILGSNSIPFRPNPETWCIHQLKKWTPFWRGNLAMNEFIVDLNIFRKIMEEALRLIRRKPHFNLQFLSLHK